MGLILSNEDVDFFKSHLRSATLFLSAHPENEEDSEMNDRFSYLEDLEKFIYDNQQQLED